jgi:hypothetical protein
MIWNYKLLKAVEKLEPLKHLQLPKHLLLIYFLVFSFLIFEVNSVHFYLSATIVRLGFVFGFLGMPQSTYLLLD